MVTTRGTESANVKMRWRSSGGSLGKRWKVWRVSGREEEVVRLRRAGSDFLFGS